MTRVTALRDRRFPLSTIAISGMETTFNNKGSINVPFFLYARKAESCITLVLQLLHRTFCLNSLLLWDVSRLTSYFRFLVLKSNLCTVWNSIKQHTPWIGCKCTNTSTITIRYLQDNVYYLLHYLDKESLMQTQKFWWSKYRKANFLVCLKLKYAHRKTGLCGEVVWIFILVIKPHIT